MSTFSKNKIPSGFIQLHEASDMENLKMLMLNKNEISDFATIPGQPNGSIIYTKAGNEYIVAESIEIIEQILK